VLFMKNKIYTACLSMLMVTKCLAFEINNYQNAWNKLIKNPQNLKKFVTNMPLGADLHCHVSGAVATEQLVKLAQEQQYCINDRFVISKPIAGSCPNANFTNVFLRSAANQKKTLEAWSMQNFVPNKDEDNKTHFFDAFKKFSLVAHENQVEVITTIINDAHSQYIQYLELMLGMHGEIPKVALPAENHAIADVLNNPEYTKYIQDNIAYFANLKNAIKTKTPWLGNDVDVAWILEIKRNQPFEHFWINAVLAFAITDKVHDIVAINMVEPEYALIASQDYVKQIKLLEILHLYFPKVKIVMHAGELPVDVAQHSSVDHIATVLEYLQPLRIGHGAVIAYEKNQEKTIANMAQQSIPIEINLSSNEKILGIKGSQHPLKTYIKKQVPVVISSDNPGISKSNLSAEYLKALNEHKISLADLIQANRNSLTYSLLSGKSLWKDSKKAIPVNDCQFFKSNQCIRFIANNPKAYQQWLLEENLDSYFKTSLPL